MDETCQNCGLPHITTLRRQQSHGTRCHTSSILGSCASDHDDGGGGNADSTVYDHELLTFWYGYLGIVTTRVQLASHSSEFKLVFALDFTDIQS